MKIIELYIFFIENIVNDIGRWFYILGGSLRCRKLEFIVIGFYIVVL